MLRRRVEDVEGSLPQKVAIVLKCRMSAIQGAIYDWIKSTGTIRVDPEDELRRAQKNPNYQAKMYKNLNNKCMELRKACNHPLLNYPYFNDYSKEFLVRSCGKLWILDRVLLKLHRAGHRVLLFSTMTKLLDILEEYLQWRRLVYRRIDGTTSLEDRESAIVDFNTPGSDCFIFLLSIRAAGRGLNLQSADTVVIYDPDPNPQNEEQAVARAHRIGQKREVKVIYMEAVVDNFSSYQKEDELRTGGTEELDDDLAGKDRYMGSIESLIRNNIQQYKIDMADEVINAGRFDQRTTHEERRMTLETLLHDEERYQETVHDVPSLQEVNRMIARSEEEIELFDQMDEDFDWTGEMMKHNQVPKWLRAGSRELNAVVAKLSKKPSKNILASSNDLDLNGLSPSKTERRTRPRAPSTIYREVDEDSENSDTSSVERNTSSLQEEDGEMGEYEDEDFNVPVDGQPSDKDKPEEGLIFDGGNYGFSHVAEDSRVAHLLEEAASSGSSSGSRRLRQPATPSISLQKFGSLSALDARPKRRSKKLSDELEEGEIAASGDSHMDLQRSGSWNHDLDDGEDEQVLQPKIKRKRSMRIRPRCAIEKLEEKSSSERVPSQGGSSLPMHIGQDYDMKSRTDPELEIFSEPGSERHNLSASSLRQLRNLPPRRSSQSNVRQPGRLSSLSGSAEDAMDNCREKGNGKASSTGGTSFSGTKMSESMHRKCKNVVSKLQRRINKDGYEIVPVLYDLWKRNETSGLPKPVAVLNNTSDLRIIDQRVDNLEYNGVTEFIADVQLMLKNAVQYYNFSYEVKYEARKLNDIFFDIMKIAFPDTDFREAKNSLTFPSHGGSSAASPPKKGAAASQSKQQKMVSKPEPSRAPPKPSLCSTSPLQEEGRMTRAYASKFNKESRPATGTSSRDLAPHERPLTHPGDLVICKKKRKDRRAGPVSPSSQGRSSSGPVSPPSAGRVGPPSPPKTGRSSRVPAQQREPGHPTLQSASRPGRSTHQSTQQQHDGRSAGPGDPSGAMEEAQWAKPVKRMRTDAGKRRPSHL